jgi:hypothetical protein
MKFPKYGANAQGALLQAQELDSDTLRPYAEVRDRNQTIQKKGEFLYVEVDEPAVESLRVGPFWLSIANGTLGRTHARLPYDLYAEPIDISRSDFWGRTPDNQPLRGERDIINVGGGYVASLAFSATEETAWPVLWHIDSLDQIPVEAGTPNIGPRANVKFESYSWRANYQPIGVYGEIAPSLFPAGKDAQGRYWFGVMSIDYQESERQNRTVFAVHMGNTKDRLLQRVVLPNPPRHPGLRPQENEQWLTPTIVGIDSTLFGFSPKVFCVGVGHLMVIMVPREPIPLRRDRDLGDATSLPTAAMAAADLAAPFEFSTAIPAALPPDSAPYLLRSRDFGATWTMEKADWLNPPSYQVGIFYDARITSGPSQGAAVRYIDGETYDGYLFNMKIEAVPKLGQSFSLATQIGGGRIALFYPCLRDTSTGDNRPTNLCVGLWVSDTSGQNFVRKAWPGDRIMPALNDVMGNTLTAPHQVICLTPWLTGRQLSAGPGSLFIDTVLRHPWDKGQKDTIYPAGNQRTVLVSLDYGDSWVEQPVPAEARPFFSTWAGYVALLDPAGTNTSLRYRAPWPETQFVVAKPRAVPTSGGPPVPAELWFFVLETDVVVLWKTTERFDTWERMYAVGLTGALMFSDLAVGTPQPLFVGDDGDSGEYLSRLHVGYPAMGEEK